MIKSKTVALALALAGIAGCRTVDPSNLFGHETYKLGIGSAPSTKPLGSYPQPEGTGVVIKAGMNI